MTRVNCTSMIRGRSTDDVRVRGSGVLNQMRSGATITLYDLLYLMISISDNLATDALINMAGVEAINRTTADLGMKNSRLAGTLQEAFAGAPELGRATPNDYATAIRAILDGKAASEESCQAMTALLETQQNRRRIARYLPHAHAALRNDSLGQQDGHDARRLQRSWFHHRAKWAADHRGLYRALCRYKCCRAGDR